MQLKKANCIPQTTSLGRIFDAASAILGVCYERTYEGEAAMKLESCAEKGEDVFDLPIIMCGDVLDTSLMIREVYENRDKFPVADIAYSVHSYLGKGLANIAVSKAQEQGIHAIGLSGGAAVNRLLATVMREVVESYGLQFFVHESVPAGDGGVSFGQAVVGAFDKF
jgi:hydrogenase maturation protein HypF